RDLQRDFAAQREQASLLAAEVQPGLLEQLLGQLGQPPFAGNAYAQVAHNCRIAHDFEPPVASCSAAGLPRDAFSSSPEMPNRRASSASTSASRISRKPSSTNRW